MLTGGGLDCKNMEKPQIGGEVLMGIEGCRTENAALWNAIRSFPLTFVELWKLEPDVQPA